MRTACVLSAIMSVSVCAAPSGLTKAQGFLPPPRTETLSITLPTAIDAPTRHGVDDPDANDQGRAMLALLCIDLDSLLTARKDAREALLTRSGGFREALTLTLDL